MWFVAPLPLRPPSGELLSLTMSPLPFHENYICIWAWEICLHFVARVIDKKLAATEASSTRLRWKQLPKMQLFKNALQNEVIWKHRFPVLMSTDENGNFRKRWSHSNWWSRAGWECFSATFPFLRHIVYLKMNISYTLNI